MAEIYSDASIENIEGDTLVVGISMITTKNEFVLDATAFAAVIGSLASAADLLSKIQQGGGDIVSIIKEMERSIKDIRETVIRIERFMNTLPLMIDAAVEKHFAKFVSETLQALVELYLEVKQILEIDQELDPVFRSIIENDFKVMRLEGRLLRAYGAPAGTVLAFTAVIEDEYAKLIGLKSTARKISLKSHQEYFNEVIYGNPGFSSSELGLSAYLERIGIVTSKFRKYCDRLVEIFPNTSHSFVLVDWTLYRSDGPGGYEYSYRTIRTNTVVFSPDSGFSLAAEDISEEKSVRIPDERWDKVVETNIEDTFPDAGDSLDKAEFKTQLFANENDVAYANSVLKKLTELEVNRDSVKAIMEIYQKGLDAVKLRLAGVD